MSTCCLLSRLCVSPQLLFSAKTFALLADPNRSNLPWILHISLQFSQLPQKSLAMIIFFFVAVWDIASASMTLLHKDKQCDTSAGEVYLPSSRKTSDLAACLSSCTSEKACRSVTYYPSGFCSHFVTQCLNTDSAPGANSYTLASDPTSSIVGTKYLGEKCSEGETREGAPGYVFHMNFCLETCAQSKECNSITYAPSGYCHHFTSDCSKRTYMSGALSFQVKKISTSAAYDIADCGSECNHKETKYLPQTSEYVLTLKHCLESCSRIAECESVSFYYDGFCSHFSAEPRAKSKVMEKVCHKKHKDFDECKINNGGCDSKRKCTSKSDGHFAKCEDCSAGYVNDGAKGCKGYMRALSCR